MLLSKVFLAGLLVLCIGSEPSNGQDATIEPQPPDFGRGFVGFVWNKMKSMFVKNRKDNSDSVQRITNNINQTMTLISEDIRAVGTQIGKFRSDVGVIMGLGNSSGDLVQKALTLAVQGTSIGANILELLNVLQKTFNDVYQGFHRILDTILLSIDTNFQFATNFVSYAPSEVGKKLKVVYDHLIKILIVIKDILLAAIDEVRIVTLQGAITIVNGGLPIQRFLNNVFQQLQEVFDRISEQVANLHSTLVNILTNIQTVTTKTIDSALTTVRQGFESIMTQIHAIRDKVFQQFSPSNGNAPPATTAPTEATTAPTVASTAAPANKATTLASMK